MELPQVDLAVGGEVDVATLTAATARNVDDLKARHLQADIETGDSDTTGDSVAFTVPVDHAPSSPRQAQWRYV